MKHVLINCVAVNLLVFLAFVPLIASSGCARVPETGSTELTQNPYARKAREAAQNRNYLGAVELYRKALRVNPDLASAHLELGLLYDDKLGDPIAAIYHYRCFLSCVQTRPNVRWLRTSLNAQSSTC